jgi:serine/threonine-protein kinase
MTHRPTSSDGFSPGERIASYTIEAELSRGPNGIVYRAQHVVMPRRVTIRVMHAVQTWVRQVAIQMMREACFLEALQHSGAPRVFECGLLADKRAWIALEAIDGTPLSELLARGLLASDVVAALVGDVADVLEHAHRRGVVHRALRPSAIIYTSGRAFPLCIADWSDARAHDSQSEIPRVVSRAYAAPESIRGHAVDDRADIYSLGAIAYHALTGRVPGEQGQPPLLALCPSASPVLAALVDQMLAPHPGDRPNVGEVRASASVAAMRGPALLPPLRLGKLAAGSGAMPPHLPRFSAPRWTPPIGNPTPPSVTVPSQAITSERDAVVVGEIDDHDAARMAPAVPRRN